MENQRKWIVISYLGVSILFAWILHALLYKAVGAYDLEARVRNIDLIIQGSSIVLGAILFFILSKHTKINQFMGEAFSELSRVTWPTVSDTQKATVVVIIMVLFSGVVLGMFDSFWTWILKRIL